MKSGNSCVYVSPAESCTYTYYDTAGGRYCRIISYDTSGSCNTSNGSYFSNVKGEKTSISSVGSCAYISGVGYMCLSSKGLLWWDAHSMCSAMGGSMLTANQARNYGSTIASKFIPQSKNAVWLSNSYPESLGVNSCEAETLTYQGGIGHKNRYDETYAACVLN